MIRILTILFAFGLCTQTLGQTWQSFHYTQFNNFFGFVGAIGPMSGNRGFKINPYDNSLWMSKTSHVQRLGDDGSYQVFDSGNTPAFLPSSGFNEYAFTPDYVFVVDYYYGLFKYDGTTWTQAVSFDDGVHVCADGDSVWVSRINQNYVYWKNGMNGLGTFSAFRRAEHKYGWFWGSSGQDDVVMRLDENDDYIFYEPDTCPLMDYSNYDFKFSPHNDTFYVAGDRGFSIAVGAIFVDSICADNSIAMPSDTITEFEFDQHDNIWAVFGSGFDYPSSIAYYTQSTKTWSQFYDASNSPIDFSDKITIEVDTAGNLWVCDGQSLHILKINNPPAWLGIVEQSLPELVAYPNPATTTVTLQLPKRQGKLTIVTSTGATVSSSENVSGDFVLNVSDWEKGCYLVRWTDGTQEFRGKIVR